MEFVGVGARFGPTIVSKEKNANQTRLALSDPRDCCSPPKKKVLPVRFWFGQHYCSQMLICFPFFKCFQFHGEILVVDRGNCKFTAKANFAEAAGASAVLIINNQKGNGCLRF